MSLLGHNMRKIHEEGLSLFVNNFSRIQIPDRLQPQIKQQQGNRVSPNNQATTTSLARACERPQI